MSWEDSWDNQHELEVGIIQMGWQDNWDNEDELGG